MGTKKRVEWGFGYGEPEYEFGFGLAPQHGDLSPSVRETHEPFNSPSRIRDQERGSYSNYRKNLDQHVKTWDLAASIPRDKRPIIKFPFFVDFRRGGIYTYF